jgi:hypothetical protein
MILVLARSCQTIKFLEKDILSGIEDEEDCGWNFFFFFFFDEEVLNINSD